MLPTGLSIIYAGIVLNRAQSFFAVGLVNSRVERGRVLGRLRTHVIAFACFWTVMGLMYLVSYLSNYNDDPTIVIYALLFAFRSAVMDPALFLNYIGVHFRRGGQWMPITEFCSRIFEERTSLSSGHLKDSIEGNVRDVHVFDALTSEAKEEVLAQHLRGDVIAATSLGIGYCAEEAEKQWCELVKASGKEAPTGAQVLDLVSPEHYSPEPVISYLKDMSIDGVSRAETSDMEWGQSTFYDYCPVVFHACRTAAGMTQKEYLASIHGARDALTSMVEKFSEGRLD